MKQKPKKYLIAIVAATALVLLDQLTKYLAVRYLNPADGGHDVTIISGVFKLQYLENRGAAFGIMQGRKILLVLTTVAVFALVCWLYHRIPTERRYRALRCVCISVMAGAIGNFIDRMRLGYVVDFFYFELINFPIFNVADIYVTCSVIVFLLLFLFYYKEEELNVILPSKTKKQHETKKRQRK